MTTVTLTVSTTNWMEIYQKFHEESYHTVSQEQGKKETEIGTKEHRVFG